MQHVKTIIDLLYKLEFAVQLLLIIYSAEKATP